MRQAVRAIVQHLAVRQQPVLLGVQHEHQPHHQRQRHLVHPIERHARQNRAARRSIRLIQRAHEHLDGGPHLLAQLIGHIDLPRLRLLDQIQQRQCARRLTLFPQACFHHLRQLRYAVGEPNR